MVSRPEIGGLPLRARKFAQTKLGLLRAATERLDGRTLDGLQVRELCQAVGVSQASFFNYFPAKEDLIVYFIQVWTLDVAWHALRAEPRPATARQAIERIFAVTAEQVADHPGVMAEVLAWQARRVRPATGVELTLAERLLAFPDRPGIETLPARGLDSLLPALLERAVKAGELPRHTDLGAAFLGLAAIFFGVPAVLRGVDPRGIGAAYRAQVAVYWAGLEAQRPTRGRRPGRRRARS